MPRVKRQVVKRLILLACAEISQDCLNKYEFKRKRKWVKRWSVDFICAHAAFNRFFHFILTSSLQLSFMFLFLFSKSPRHVTRDQGRSRKKIERGTNFVTLKSDVIYL